MRVLVAVLDNSTGLRADVTPKMYGLVLVYVTRDPWRHGFWNAKYGPWRV